jgi:hypothetical protein
MPNPRIYTDQQLRAAVAASTNWSAVMVAIGRKPGSGTDKVKIVAERLVEIARRVHDGTMPRNANGSRRAVPYNSDQVDYFFIITPESKFLIPINVVAGFRRIVLDVKYAAFAV